MSVEENVQIVKDFFFAAIGSGDKEGLLALVAEDIEATLLAATKSSLDELVWWAHATMAAKAAEAL